MKIINKLERKLIPNTRRKKWYKAIKAAILLPFFLPLWLIMRSLQGWGGLIRIVRKGKPDIVLSNIVEGFGNLTFPDKNTELLAHSRAAICASCPFAVKTGIYSIVADNRTKQIQGMKCDRCGCNLSAKVRSKNDSCPEGKW